ncbi:DUF3397 domain-containing protein [Thalassobacillus sp. CUG 92003]|uniref:DUF3397 domain-containing protein n=1 Tax=Thalassobacillus sp. CUG 92003 TaxID=2736641 RepID=UPI0015E69C54|nr:DUF3397 domain-containing protein [Thalassobacillus sp. CUG 92003]
MSDVISYLYAALVTLPIPIMLVILFILRKLYRHKWKAIHQTANIMTFVFILAFDAILIVQFDRSFIGFIFLALLLLLAITIITQYNRHEELLLRRALRGFWRLNFLVFGMLYMVSVVYAIASRMLE